MKKEKNCSTSSYIVKAFYNHIKYALQITPISNTLATLSNLFAL